MKKPICLSVNNISKRKNSRSYLQKNLQEMPKTDLDDLNDESPTTFRNLIEDPREVDTLGRSSPMERLEKISLRAQFEKSDQMVRKPTNPHVAKLRTNSSARRKPWKSIKPKPKFPSYDFHDFRCDKLHPDGRALKALWNCHTQEDVELISKEWLTNFARCCINAISKRKLPPEMRSQIEGLLNGSATSSPNMLNPKVLMMAWSHTFRFLHSVAQSDPEIEFALVTIIDGRGATSAHAPVVELHDARERAQRVIRAMATNFVGIQEMAMFKSHKHANGGRLIQCHQHILIYGKNIVQSAKRVAAKRMSDFAPNLTLARPIDVRPVKATDVNIARICAYLFKPPLKAMNWVPPRDGKPGFMNQTMEGTRYINLLRMAQIRSMLAIEDVVFAGGGCKSMKSDLVKLLRQTCSSHVPVSTRQLHPDAIPSFWNEVNKALGRMDYQLPVIGRNP